MPEVQGTRLSREQPGLTAQDVADELGVSKLTVYSWVRDGKLPRTRIGTGKLARIRVHPDDLRHVRSEPEPDTAAAEG